MGAAVPVERAAAGRSREKRLGEAVGSRGDDGDARDGAGTGAGALPAAACRRTLTMSRGLPMMMPMAPLR